MKKKLFTKSLTQTEISKRLNIPTKSLAFLPRFYGSNALELLVRDDNGGSWTFGCTLRKSGYPKPVVQKGWRDFVVAKGLKLGDKVTFYQQESEDGVKVFGAVFPRSCYSIEVEREVSKPSETRPGVDHAGCGSYVPSSMQDSA